MASKEQKKHPPFVWMWGVTNDRQQPHWGKGWEGPEKEPRPPAPGEEGDLSGPPWCAERLWDSQTHLLGTLGCRRTRDPGYENACHVRRGRRTWLPFLKNIKIKEPFTLPSSLGQRGQMEMEHQLRQAGPLPFAVKEPASCLCYLPFCVWPPREEHKTKQENCSEQVIAR